MSALQAFCGLNKATKSRCLPYLYRVVIGTDYPMAMGDFKPVRKIDSLTLTDEERSQVLGANATRALNL